MSISCLAFLVNFICPSLTFTFQSSLLWHQMNPNDYLRSDSSTNDQAVFVGLPGLAKSCLASIVFWLDVAPSVVALSANKNLKEHNLLDTLPIFLMHKLQVCVFAKKTHIFGLPRYLKLTCPGRKRKQKVSKETLGLNCLVWFRRIYRGHYITNLINAVR